MNDVVGERLTALLIGIFLSSLVIIAFLGQIGKRLDVLIGLLK